MTELEKKDKDVFDAIEAELNRQQTHIELIASENFVSKAVLEAQGSVMTNKYAEGYSGKRYYGGCDYVDIVENLANERVQKLFNVQYSNVQPHSGSQANMAAYRSLINLGDTILGMNLADGGHLTHGMAKNFSGNDYKVVSYGVDPKTGLIDYEDVKAKALEYKPQLIVAGASAYSRIIDFKRFREIADLVGAYLMVDMAHIAGLVAAGLHPNPCDYADIVTSTTHKTLRGPRGGIILTNNPDIIKKVNSKVFPGTQGGPLMHVIAAKAVAFGEALKPEFKEYAKQIICNMHAFCDELASKGYTLVSGGSDNHVVLLNTKASLNITGKEAEECLGKVNITVNKNGIPGDTEKPTVTSGIRLGTAAMTTRGFNEEDFRNVARLIDLALRNKDDEEVLNAVKMDVIALMKKHPYLA